MDAQQQRTIADALAENLVMAMEAREEQLDRELQRLDNIKEEDLEEIRRRRSVSDNFSRGNRTGNVH